jgi:integral membrane protein
MLKTTIGRLRLLGFAEGISFLLLLCIAMPLKYMAGMPEAVKITGMVHGILFILYVLTVFQAKAEYSWNVSKTFLALLASVLPFGTFVADAKLFKAEVK